MSQKSIEELNAARVAAHAKAVALMNVADTESRELTEDEQKQYDALLDECEQIDASISRRQRAAEVGAKLDAPIRKVPAEQPQAATQPPKPGRPSVTGGDLVMNPGTGNFSSLGDFASAVRAARFSGSPDPRLRQIQAAATTYGAEGNGADGGYAVPPDFRLNILKKIQGEESLLARTDQYTTTSNSLVLPVDETTPWQTSGGVLATWIGEGSAATASKPALQAMEVKTNKLMALVPVTDELLADAATLDSYLANKVPDKLVSSVNAAILTGDGVGKPSGIIGAASTVSCAAEGSQTAGTVNSKNIHKMWALMYAPLRSEAVWVINQDIEPQLFQLAIGGSAPGQWPAYLPPGGMSSAPYGTLMGRPVIYSEFASAVGTVGDITFVNLKQYISLVKAGGVRSDMSLHLYFDQDMAAFRFIQRVGGQPWWKTSMTRAKSSSPLSWAVTLAAR